MVRLRIALGVAASIVAVAALTIVFAVTGVAQGNGNGLPNGPNVVVTNTPLPVTGNVTATMSGNVSANIINPANNPVLVRNVDGKELWQENREIIIPVSFPDAFIEFSTVPAGKALVIEHVNVRVADSGSDAPELSWIVLYNQFPFGASPGADGLTLVTRTQDETSVADAVTKFYVGPGQTPRVYVSRTDLNTLGSAIALLTGYLVNYP
jgi:hypothetical protein